MTDTTDFDLAVHVVEKTAQRCKNCLAFHDNKWNLHTDGTWTVVEESQIVNLIAKFQTSCKNELKIPDKCLGSPEFTSVVLPKLAKRLCVDTLEDAESVETSATATKVETDVETPPSQA